MPHLSNGSHVGEPDDPATLAPWEDDVKLLNYPVQPDRCPVQQELTYDDPEQLSHEDESALMPAKAL